MSVVDVDSGNFEQEVKNADIPVLVDFSAEWCMPCKMLSPIVDEIGSERTDIKVCKLDVDSSQDLAMEFGVMSVPTVILFKDGKRVDQFIGALPKDDIVGFINKHV